MDVLTPQIPKKNIKILEEELSLPKILEKTPARLPRTASCSHKQKTQLKYASETTLSPEEEHLQGQIRKLLHKGTPKYWPEPLRTLIPTCQSPTRHSKPQLPKLSIHSETSLKDSRQAQEAIGSIWRRKGRSLSGKVDLSSILKDQSSFVENYFAELSKLSKR